MASFDSPEMLRALEGIEKGDYSNAFELLVPLAQTGNPKAQCNLANLYHFGWGVKVDAEKAIELYHKVAQQNIREEYLSGLAYQSLATISPDFQGFSRTLGVLQNLQPVQKSWVLRCRSRAFAVSDKPDLPGT